MEILLFIIYDRNIIIYELYLRLRSIFMAIL